MVMAMTTSTVSEEDALLLQGGKQPQIEEDGTGREHGHGLQIEEDGTDLRKKRRAIVFGKSLVKNKVIPAPYHVAKEKLLAMFRHLWEDPSVRPLNGNNSKEENGDAVSMQFDNYQFSYKERKTTSQIASRIPLAKTNSGRWEQTDSVKVGCA
ncbi:uncharacterized protein LOC119307078 isoform X2 [Triticum dicoccoides]|uniref:uncharacterized protein LOC119307078 isoform X2 n=1 Tax=Triticum dicoccoides TaxID=85692 RepID=UPI00188E0579|nr:uncharacterized protein LOC119307078 isoform X2 [Triticum dicoccoides]